MAERKAVTMSWLGCVITLLPFAVAMVVWIWYASARVTTIEADIAQVRKETEAIRQDAKSIRDDAKELQAVVRMVHDAAVSIQISAATSGEKLAGIQEDVKEIKLQIKELQQPD